MPTSTFHHFRQTLKRSTASALLLVAVTVPLHLTAQTPRQAPITMTTPLATPAAFDPTATAALLAMQQRAAELKITGVAVVAYFEGDTITSWSSKMLVVGHLKDERPAPAKSSNLLAVAYTKAAEMADTLKDSGSGVRPPLTGEFGWQGGLIARGRTGFLVAAFSGGKSEDDVEVSRAGLAALKSKL